MSVQTEARVSDPSIASIIFAPRAQNYTLASVILDALSEQTSGLDYWLDPEELPRQKMLTGIGWTRLEWIVSEYLRNYYIALESDVAVTVGGRLAERGTEVIPQRTFPFGSHLNLLGGGDEGIFVDPDESVER